MTMYYHNSAHCLDHLAALHRPYGTLHKVLVCRFIEALPKAIQYIVSTLFDPRLKFLSFGSHPENDNAIQTLKKTWIKKWQPQGAEQQQPKCAAEKKRGMETLLEHAMHDEAHAPAYVARAVGVMNY